MFFWPLHRLRVVKGRLYAKKPFRRRAEIAPRDILEVREFTGNNPFLGVRTTKGNYAIGLFRRDYVQVLHLLAQNRGLDLSQAPGHVANRLLYWPAFAILKKVGWYTQPPKIAIPAGYGPNETRSADLTKRKKKAELSSLWRILLGVLITYFTGFLWCGLFVEDASIDLALPGGMLAAPAGFLGGLFWHLADKRRRKDAPRGLLLAFGGVVLAFSAGASILWMEFLSTQTAVRALRSVSPDAVRGIAVYDKGSETLLLRISDRAALRDFANACRDIRVSQPSHPGYLDTWYVVIEGPRRFQLECSYTEAFPDKILGHFVDKQGPSTVYFGEFESVSLRNWFESYVSRGDPREF